MRKFLMASAATLGAVSIAGAASAQTTPPPTFLEGQVATTPSASPPAYANTNNAYQGGPALPGAIAIPTPGTFVIKLNVAVVVEASLQSSSVSTYTQPAAPAGAGTGAVAFATAGGTYKQNVQSFQSYVRLYPGLDAMATNGLRYGAGVEVRENFSSTTPAGGNLNGTSASSFTSAQTLFVRRNFVYVAGDQWGIVRFGQADGVTGIFDNGVTSFQSVSPSGGMNGSDVQTPIPGNMYMGFPFPAQNGVEYGNEKLVYLSPQFFGFDIGLQYAPSNNNAEYTGAECTNGTTSDPSVLGATGVNAAYCSTTSSSPLASDAARYTNQVVAGLRYQGTFGPVSALVWGAYEASGIVDYTGAAPAVLHSGTFNGKYNGLSFGDFGAALTVAGLTFGGTVLTGAVNNNSQVNPQPQGGAKETAFLIGFQYNYGPLAAGFAYEQADSQGAPALSGITQRHEWGLNPGIDWVVAPGLKVFAEYFYGQRHQGDFNFATGGVGSTAYNDVRAQAFLVGSRVYW